MSTFLLWVAVIAVGVALEKLRQRLARAEDRIQALRELVEDLAAPPPAAIPTPPSEPEEAGPEAVAAAAPPPAELPPAAPPALQLPPAVKVPAAPSPAAPPAPAAAPPVASAVAPPTGTARRRPSIDWERWLGVRGAAILGGAVLALAAILFLKYSIEHDLIPPIVRVALGFLAGGLSIVGSEAMRRRRYGATADAVAGAGVVILYASVWAARVLYALIPGPLSWALMILVTAVCGLLAWRRASLVIALLGLIGGFVTPLLLATRAVEPIGLFSYVLLLDVGLLWLASRRGWPLLATLSLAGTFLYQASWVFGDMPPARYPLTLGILGLFALVFAFAGSRGARGAGPPASGGLVRAAGVLLPFLFALELAGRSDLGRHLAPLAALLLLLSLAAAWIGRVQKVVWLAPAAAAADLGVVALWVARTWLTPALAWELAAVAVALALAFHWPLELDRRRGEPAGGWRAAVLAAGGLALLVVFARLRPGSSAVFWPWLVAWLALTALWLRQAAIVPLPRLRLAAAALPAIAFTVYLAVRGNDAAMPPPALFLALVVIVAAAFQPLGLAARRERAATLDAPDAAAALAALASALGIVLLVDHPIWSAGYFLATTLVLGLLAILAATRLGAGVVYLGAAALMVLGQTAWTFGRGGLESAGSAAVAVLCGGLASVVLVSFWPFVAGRRLAADRWTSYTAALAAPAWFPLLRRVYEHLFGDGLIAILPLALGALSLAAALSARRFWPRGRPERERGLVWFLAVALGFVSLAIPLQLAKEWITIGWALQGLAVMALWRRLDHPGLRLFGLALLAAVTVRLVANPALFGYHPGSGRPIFNWLAYTYLVPAAALLWSARIQEPLEVARRSPWEAGLYGGRRPLGAAACGMAAILVVFVWLNLTIVDAFAGGSALSLSLERLPARDLTLSLAWILYAVLLLALGMARRSVALRWISLAFLVLAIGKVFLYDLGELRELYRVGSLVGLALSLLLVSLAYQRFVFRERDGAAEDA